MGDLQELLNHDTCPSLVRMPGLVVADVLLLNFDHVREAAAFDEVLPSNNVLILDKESVVNTN